MVVRALTRFRPPRARGLVGEAAIGSRPRNCFGNFRLNESPPTLTRRLLPCTFTHSGAKPLLASRPDRWTRASLVNRSGRSNSFGHHVDRPRLRLRGIADPIAYGTAARPEHRASRRLGAEKIYGGRVWGRAPAITKTERRRSANLLRMPTGLMCKLR